MYMYHLTANWTYVIVPLADDDICNLWLLKVSAQIIIYVIFVYCALFDVLYDLMYSSALLSWSCS